VPRPLLATPALGEPDELAADARAAVSRVSDQHPEFALTGVQPLDPYDANDPLPGPGDRDLPGGDQPGHFGRRGTGRTVHPETLVGGGVHTVDERRELVDQHGVSGGRRRCDPDIDHEPIPFMLRARRGHHRPWRSRLAGRTTRAWPRGPGRSAGSRPGSRQISGGSASRQ